MIDDLVTQGRDGAVSDVHVAGGVSAAPAGDNADQRLTPLGLAVGCVGEDRRKAFEKKLEGLERAQGARAGPRGDTGGSAVAGDWR